MLDKITKKDLRTGMRVTVRSGSKYIVFLNMAHKYDDETDIILSEDSQAWEAIDRYAGDLTAEYSCDDIVKVEIPLHCYAILNEDHEYRYETLWLRDLTI